MPTAWFLTLTLVVPLFGAGDRSPPVDAATQLRQLAGRLRAVAIAPDERLRIEQSMLGFGEDGARALLPLLDEHLDDLFGRFDKQRSSYLNEYRKGVRKQVSRRARQAQREIEELRALLGRLRSEPDLDKQRIVEVGDPALARLTALLSVDNADLLQREPKLVRSRDDLLQLGFAIADAQSRRLDCAKAAGLGDATAEPLAFDPVASIDDEEQWIAALALPMSDRDRATMLANREVARQLEAEELRGVEYLNLLRIRLGLGVLAVDLRLTDASRDHSSDMVTVGFFSHESPVPGKKTFGDRVARFKTSAHAENIAAGQASGPAAIDGWWHSPGHHKNMLGSHGRIGLGRSGNTWTQLFG